MASTAVQITIYVGLGLRGALGLFMAVCAFVTAQSESYRVAGTAALLAAESLFGSLAVLYDTSAAPYAQQLGAAGGALFVVLLLACVFKLRVLAAVWGVGALLLSLLGYAFVQMEPSQNDLQTGYLVVSAIVALAGIVAFNYRRELWTWPLLLLFAFTVVFYAAVFAASFFNNNVMSDWSPLAVAIVWEAGLSSYYWVLALVVWWNYNVASADVFDWFAFQSKEGAFAESRPHKE